MIFLPDHCKAIIEGRKTQTRRLQKLGHRFISGRGSPDRVYYTWYGGKKILKWQVGREYSVQPGRGELGVARIKLLDIKSERVQAITEEDAKAEGVSFEYIAKGTSVYYSPSSQSFIDSSHFLFDEMPDREKLQGYRGAFAIVWNNIYKKANNWLENSWVWALTFELATTPG